MQSNQVSALGMPIFLDFVVSCRCQVADNSLQPGRVMLFGQPPEVGNGINVTSTVRVFNGSVFAPTSLLHLRREHPQRITTWVHEEFHVAMWASCITASH